MRDIRFRAWNVDKKEWISVFHLANMGDVIISKEIGAQPSNEDSKAIIMQFTGLYDKNGVGIYEGDIVIDSSWVDEEDRVPYVVKFGEFSIETYYHVMGFYLSDGDDNTINMLFNKDCKIIGNIYETPELIAP